MESLLVGESENKEGESNWRVAGGGISNSCGLLAEELKKVSYIAFPMVVVNVAQNLLRVASMSMIGHLGVLELAGAAIANSLANVTGFGLLFGMAGALETLCGQAYGAGQYQKLGVYTYAGIISLLLVCLPVSLLWMFTDKLLVLIGQDPLISAQARIYTAWLIPALFPFAILQLLIRYLQTQSLVLPMLWSSVVVLLFHLPVCWALVFKLKLGIAGGALAISISYTLNVLLIGFYVNYSIACKRTRIHFSDDVLRSMRDFFQFGIPSAIMTCLEWWIYELVVLLAGLLPNPQLQTSVLSICLIITALHYFVPYSFGAAASTRVSNELGSGNPGAAGMAIWATMVLALVEVIITVTILYSCRSVLGYAFGNEKEVSDYVEKMTPFICLSVMTDSMQTVLCGVARGSGWQHIGAYINLGAYYLVGIPVALVLGFVLHLSGRGLWLGLIVGTLVQALMLAIVTCFTDWNKQVIIIYCTTTLTTLNIPKLLQLADVSITN